ncbi:MAG: aldo/keto reductase [Solirubrobacterales bacterium]|nr:aldo/keto reductase [Solirubrobacterales bacterium]
MSDQVPQPTRAVGHVALGAWSGGRYLQYGETIAEERLQALLTPGEGIHTILTADAYGAGQADEVVGRAIAGVPREQFCLVGAVGHDFYEGEREGAKGYPRFTDARLRGPEAYADYLKRATERHLARLGVDELDVLLLHNPDRTGYTSPVVWEALASLRDEGLTHAIGVAPGPANGFTLDVIACLERFGELMDWAMLILNPFEPWPGELALRTAAAQEVAVIARVVDYGGLFWDDVRPGHSFAERDHRLHRPPGWIEAGMAKLEAVRPFAEAHGLTMLQLAAQWDLAHTPVACVAPTLIQEPGGRTIEQKRAELAATPHHVVLGPEEVEQIRAIGDNTGSMALKGANPDYDGAIVADRWPLETELVAAGARWGVDAERDLAHAKA